MFKIQGLDLSPMLENIQVSLVRTYKGEITRTLSGHVVAFPASFITVGFSIQLLGPRANIIQAQQLLLSADIVKIVTTYNGVDIEGNFSCTSNDVQEVKDKADRSLRLSATLVSDGTDITKPGGAYFTIKFGATTLYNNCSFGKAYKLPGLPFRNQGVVLPDNRVLVLGDVEVTR